MVKKLLVVFCTLALLISSAGLVLSEDVNDEAKSNEEMKNPGQSEKQSAKFEKTQAGTVANAVYDGVYEEDEVGTGLGLPEHANVPDDVRGLIEQRLEAIEEYKNNPELARQRKNAPLEDKIFVRGEQLEFDVPPVIENSRTLIPVRAVSESLGATVDWIGEDNKVVIEKDDITIEITLGEKIVSVDGQEMELEVPGNVRNGRTLVPLRFVSEILGDEVTYHSETDEIDIGELKWAKTPDNSE